MYICVYIYLYTVTIDKLEDQSDLLNLFAMAPVQRFPGDHLLPQLPAAGWDLPSTPLGSVFRAVPCCFRRRSGGLHVFLWGNQCKPFFLHFVLPNYAKYWGLLQISHSTSTNSMIMTVVMNATGIRLAMSKRAAVWLDDVHDKNLQARPLGSKV